MIDQIKQFIAANGSKCSFPPANAAAIERAEASLQLRLPDLLKRCYLEIANGGFGPGLGVLGVEEGFAGDYGNIIATYKVFARDFETLGRVWQKDLIPFCTWGCAIMSCVTCDGTLRITKVDSGRVWPQQYTIEAFFKMWLDGVNILAADPDVYEAEMTMKNPFTGKPLTTKRLRRRESGH